MIDKPVPHDLDAERAVLGGLLVTGRIPEPDQVASLEPVHFFRDAHRVIFETMRTLSSTGGVIDLVTLKGALGSNLDRVGGPAYIASLTDGVPRSTNVPAYAAVVRECSDARAMIAALDRARDRLYADPAVASNGLAADVSTQLDAIRQQKADTSLHLVDDVEMIVRPEPSMLVSGVLTAGSFAGLFAPPGFSKTFLIVELGIVIATGRTFFGAPVPEPGNVLHVLGEGGGLFGRRLSAAKRKHGIASDTPVGYYTLPESVDLLNPERVGRLIEVAKDISPMVVFIDTVNRSMSGDENATADMTAFVSSVDRIRTELNTAVVGVHHTGWDERRERGSNVLRASVDTLLSLRRGDDGVLTLACEKQRDIEPFAPFQLRQISQGDSCVMQLAFDTSERNPNEEKALAALRDLYDGSRPVPSGKWCAASRLTARTFERVKKAVMESGEVERIRGKYRPLQKVANSLPRSEEAIATELP